MLPLPRMGYSERGLCVERKLETVCILGLACELRGKFRDPSNLECLALSISESHSAEEGGNPTNKG